jgi:cysteine dioxygenase
MTLLQRIKEQLGCLEAPSPYELRQALIKLNATKEDLTPFLLEAGEKPYSRKLLYKNDVVEVLVMNWSKEIDCAPHDHGQSMGWIQVVAGESNHTIYRVEEGKVPDSYMKRKEAGGTIFFAPKRIVHKMGSAEEEPLITLHVYSPPISGMKVYDVEKCAACIVSDDCGAWWPEKQRQLIKEIKLKRAAHGNV